MQAVQSFKDGLSEMQDEGSQLLSLLLEPKPGQTVVDSCAGGGGKTVHIAALMNNIGKLISIDIDEKRLRNIQPRLIRSGVTIAQLLHSEKDADSIAAYVRKADSVLVDAPCSGVGTFRRNPAAKIYFNQAQVDYLAITQHNVLESYSVLVKPGGRLVYTTCTLLRKENEEIVGNFLKQNPIFRVIPAAEILRRQGIFVESSSDFLSFFPHRNGTDGFFAAVMELKP